MAAAVECAATSLVEPPPGHRVLSVRHFEATPPANINQGLIDGDVIATTKEEEWVTKKKTELTTTRQIETRVKRQLVLEDGKVVEDSGPIVSTNTTEDTEKQEHEHTEHRTTGDDPPGEGWLAIPMEGEGAVVKEVRERVVHSKEEKEDLTETEDVKILGDLSDEAYLESVRSNQDVRLALRPTSGLDSTSPGGAVVSLNGPRIVHQSSRTRRIVDTDDAQELSKVQNGHVVTETRRTTEHEEDRGEDVPEDDGGASEEEREVNHKEGTQRYAHTKEQDLVEFIGSGGRKIGEHMRYSAENVEGETQGDQDPEWESLSTRMQKMRRHQPGPAAVGSPLADPTSADTAAAAAAAQARKDALTKRPLDFDQEEETRKKETSKWLEHHFGSDSRSSKSSVDEEQAATPSGAHFINVTMKSRPINGTTPANNVSHSPRPISPVIKTPVPTPFTPARVFLSSPEPSSEPTSFVNTPPPPPPPILPTSPGRLLLNGRQNSSSSGGSGKNYFQGVTEWSERRNSGGVNSRQDRVQVLPTGPGHTFNTSRTQTTVYNGVQSSVSQPRVNGTTSPPAMLNHVKNTSIHSSMNHSRLNGATSPNPSFNSSSRMNGTTSPRPLSPPDRLNGSVSPAEYIQRPISPPQGYREEVKTWRGRTVSPVRQQPVQSSNRRGSVEILQSEQQHRTVFKESHRSERRGSGDLLRHKGSSELRHSSPREIEPPPDYSPGRRRRSRHTSSPSPSPPPYEHSRKSNQKTRFADPSPPQKNKSSFGDSLRRFVGKFRSSDEKKQKRKANRSSPSRQGLENNNIPSSVSRRQRVGRGESPPNEAVRRGSAEEEVYYSDEEEGVGMTSPVPPPRVRQRQPSPSHHHQLDSRLRRENMMEPRRFYLGEDPFGGSIYGREKEYDGVTPPSKSSSAGRNGRHHSYRSHRRGSQPDEEHTSTTQTRNVVWHEDVRNKPSYTHQPVTATLSNTSTLGRYSRSTGRLHSQHEDNGYPRSTQTLPRKLTPRDEPVQTSRVITTTTTRTQQQLQHTPVTRSSSQWETSRLSRNQPHSGSLINVSFVNNVTPNNSAIITGPAKPARTYRSSLARSQSFNVTGNEAPPPRRIFQQQQNKTSSYYRSNPHLHRLDEASSPLKSPGIISSISRSQKDLNEAIKHEALIEEEESRFSPRIGSKSPSAGINASPIGNSMHETKKKLFMKGLLDRAPELYRTLHGDEAGPVSPSAPHATNTPHRVEYSSSFRESSLAPGVRPARTRRSTTSPPTSLLVPTNLHNGDSKTLLSPSQSFRSSGTGSNKDYSETVRYTSTSGDPMRPSVTNTVQSFSKKTVPSPRTSGGVATETIESKETTTVTKSRTRGEPQSTYIYSNNNNAAVTSSAKNNYSSYDQKTPTRNGGVVIEVRPR